jgi:aldose 1-epimerase
MAHLCHGMLMLAVGLMLTAAAVLGEQGMKAGIRRTTFGRMPDGQTIELYTLTNRQGMQVAITNYGGRVVKLIIPDRHGNMADVVLGFDDLQGYLGKDPFFGALVGRYANRIGNAHFKLDGVEYKLEANDGKNSLHGGSQGFDKKVWIAKDMAGPEPALELTYLSKDGEEGYPGNLTATVVCTLTGNNELKIDYEAITDKDTVVNLTNHSYFNLAGQGPGDILKTEVTINADRFTPVDATLIPTGELRKVEGTPLDFRKPTAIGARINADDEQMRFGKGYDHDFVLNRKGPGLVLAARAVDPDSGRELEVYTTQPGVQFYTGNFLDGSLKGKGGVAYPKRSGFCLETQHYPDSPNKPNFPSTELKPGHIYHEVTVFKFSVAKANGN